MDEKKQRLNDINQKILTLEWDKRHNQLSQSKEQYLESLVKERDTLVSELKPVS